MSATKVFNWPRLPLEMKLTVLEHLSLFDVWSCSRVDRENYSVCLPILFRTVNLPTYDALLNFLSTVPSHHYAFIHDLSICTGSSTDDLRNYDAFDPPISPEISAAVAALLSHCTSLESLSLSVYGSFPPEVILPVFKGLERVRRFRLENLAQEEVKPLSERLAVSLAFSLPLLEDLSLTRITRSAIHAPELLCTNVPCVQRDECVPAHPLLGDELRLPQLFRLPNLKRLRLRDTHLGDPQWAGPELVCCPLEVLDLGSCAYVSPSANEMHTARILARAPSSITTCALTSLPPSSPSPPPTSHSLAQNLPSRTGNLGNTPNTATSAASEAPSPSVPRLPHLRTLHLTPLVPTSALGATLAQPALAGSPVHTLACAFHADDAAEGCAALEDFLREREARTGSGVARRKRASSKLSMCTKPEGFAEEMTGKDSLFKPAFDMEAGSSCVRASTSASVAQLYPALRTLSIDIPADTLSPQSPAKLSPRRLAAARRRAEERREAAMRLQALAQELGLELIVRGVDLESVSGSAGLNGVPGYSGAIPKSSDPRAVARNRANSA
ncbi:hypothetical protein DFH11DRAFT_1583168 [Phellopilus nigrolimitatus]|nr:hypothetical protein DFH11DRAFT_1583168 [Phellopilus nigrolimitatus]